jgi:hypothetical protein
MADRLTLTRAFEGRPAKRRCRADSNETYAIHDNVATKADVDNIRSELAIAVRDLKDLGAFDLR